MNLLIYLILLILPELVSADQACSSKNAKIEDIQSAIDTSIVRWDGVIRGMAWLNGDENAPSSEQSFSSIYDATLNNRLVGESIRFGKPFQLYDLSSEKILAHKSGDGMQALTNSSSTWWAPVFIGKKPTSIVNVSCMEGKLQIISSGLKSIVEQLNAFSDTPSHAQLTDIKVVRTYQPYGFFITGRKKNKEIAYPITAKNEFSQLRRLDSDGYDPDDIVKDLAARQLK